MTTEYTYLLGKDHTAVLVGVATNGGAPAEGDELVAEIIKKVNFANPSPAEQMRQVKRGKGKADAKHNPSAIPKPLFWVRPCNRCWGFDMHSSTFGCTSCCLFLLFIGALIEGMIYAGHSTIVEIGIAAGLLLALVLMRALNYRYRIAIDSVAKEVRMERSALLGWSPGFAIPFDELRIEVEINDEGSCGNSSGTTISLANNTNKCPVHWVSNTERNLLEKIAEEYCRFHYLLVKLKNLP